MVTLSVSGQDASRRWNGICTSRRGVFTNGTAGTTIYNPSTFSVDLGAKLEQRNGLHSDQLKLAPEILCRSVMQLVANLEPWEVMLALRILLSFGDAMDVYSKILSVARFLQTFTIACDCN